MGLVTLRSEMTARSRRTSRLSSRSLLFAQSGTDRIQNAERMPIVDTRVIEAALKVAFTAGRFVNTDTDLSILGTNFVATLWRSRQHRIDCLVLISGALQMLASLMKDLGAGTRATSGMFLGSSFF